MDIGTSDAYYARKICKEWNLNLNEIIIPDVDIEQVLIDMNSMWKDKPNHSLKGNFWSYIFISYLSNFTDFIIGGMGSSTLLREYHCLNESIFMLKMMIKKRDYNIQKALKILEKSNYPDMETNFNIVDSFKIRRENYLSNFLENLQTGFLDESDLKYLELPIPSKYFKLENDNLQDFLDFLNDWWNQGDERKRYDVWGKSLGIRKILGNLLM